MPANIPAASSAAAAATGCVPAAAPAAPADCPPDVPVPVDASRSIDEDVLVNGNIREGLHDECPHQPVAGAGLGGELAGGEAVGGVDVAAGGAAHVHLPDLGACMRRVCRLGLQPAWAVRQLGSPCSVHRGTGQLAQRPQGDWQKPAGRAVLLRVPRPLHWRPPERQPSQDCSRKALVPTITLSLSASGKPSPT